MKTLADQIKDLENTRAAKAARMAEVMQKSIDEGRSTDEAEGQEFDDIEAEIKTIDQDLVRLKRLEALNVVKAATPEPRRNVEAAPNSGRSAPSIILNRQPEEKFKGQFFTRKIIAKALAYLEQTSQTMIAVQRGWNRDNPLLVEVIKANEVPGGGSGSGEWGAELVQADTRYTGDFIEYLYAQTVFDRLPLREVPANVTIKGQDGAATGYWTGESKAIKATTVDFSSVNLSPLEVGALAVVSNQLLRDSSPSAEMLVRDALVQASAQAIDGLFFSTTAASAGVAPAGILNGVVSMGSFGTDGAAVRADIRQLYAPFIAAKNASNLALVTNKSIAKAIQLLVNALGQEEFKGLTQEGGTLLGDPAYTGDNVGTGDLILLKPSDIYKIGDTGVQVAVSRDATIEMATDPTGASDTPAGGTKNPVSMFQTNSTAIKVTRSVNWAKRRAGAVQYVRDAAYGDIETES